MNVMVKIGRPSDFTPELLEEICERLAVGEPLAVICRDERMPCDGTVRNWARGDTSVSDAIADARARGFDHMAADCLVIADDRSNDVLLVGSEENKYEVCNTEFVQRAKLRIDTRLKLLAKWDPKRYGDLRRVEMTAEIQVESHQTVDVASLSYEQRTALRDALEASLARGALDVTPREDGGE